MVDEDTTTHGADADGLVFHAHFGNDFGYQLMHHAMTTAWAIVHRGIVHQSGFLIDEGAFADDF